MLIRRILPALLLAAAALEAQVGPAIRPLGQTVAIAADSLGSGFVAVRELSDGRVLVNDLANRRVLLLDSNLRLLRVVADTTSETGTAYAGRLGGLIPWKGDTTLFVDPQSLSMLVIEPSGKLGRVIAIPRAEDANALTGVQGTPGLDRQGRLIYRAALQFTRGVRTPGGPPAPPTPPESAAIVRLDLRTRTIDTLAWIRIPRLRMHVQQEGNRMSMTSEINPLPVVDDWAVMADGSLAIVRGQDYHVDWVDPDGGRRSSPKVPFEWQRLTDEDKVAFIDSVKAARARQEATVGAGSNVVAAPPGGAGGGEPRVMITMVGPGGESPPPRGGASSATPRTPQVTFIPPGELPDYKPPFFAGAARADLDGHLWVRTIPTRQYRSGPVYDVINGKGELVDRVQIPAGRTIVGFGPGGVVYLLARQPGGARAVLEKARVR